MTSRGLKREPKREAGLISPTQKIKAPPLFEAAPWSIHKRQSSFYCAAGKHSLLWLEHPGSATTTTFYGNDSTISNSGIRGTLLG